MTRAPVASFCAALLLFLSTTAAAAAARVDDFSPRGTVKGVRQVTARFSAPMVPLGDPRPPEAPFESDCGEPGSGSWLDGRTWAWDFDRDLPGGVRCTFTLRAGLRSLEGAVVEGERAFSFDTGGPSVRSSIPGDGNESIDEEQAFVLVLDAEASETSIEEHVWFTVEGLPERIGVRVLSEEERQPILATLRPWEIDGGPVIVLQARQRFPSETRVSLAWGKGVATASGVATNEEQSLEFHTRPSFKAYVRCERQNEHADCVPFLPITVSFTSPVLWTRAREIAIVGPSGERWTPTPPDPPEDSVYRVSFAESFPEKAAVSVELPAALADDAGRSLVNAGEYPLAVRTASDPPLAKFSSRFGILEDSDPVLPVTIRNLEPEVIGQRERVSRDRSLSLAQRVEEWVGRVTGQVRRVEAPEDVLPWLRAVGIARRAKSVFAGGVPGSVAPVASPPAAASTPDPAATGAVAPASDPQSFTLPQPAGPQPFQVVGIPLEAPGLYVVELSSRKLGAALLGRDEPLHVATAALVTGMAVHFKWGAANSLVWVTRLEDAAPVAAADVAVQDCGGEVLWSGTTNAEGFALIEGLPRRDQVRRCQVVYPSDDEGDEAKRDDYDDHSDAEAINPWALAEGLLVTAQMPGDLSFVHTSWSDGIQPWRFQLPAGSAAAEDVAHTVFARTLLRPGETVHMKHVLRAETMRGFDFVAPERRPDVLEIQHLGGSDKFELPLAWDDAGVAESVWVIPGQAKLGTYNVILRRSGSESWRDRWQSGSFRVEEFRVPLLRGVVQLPATPLVRPAEVPVDVSVQYLSGGGAGGLPVRLRSQIRPKTFQPPVEFEHFVFGNGGVVEGVQARDDEEEPEPDTAPAVHQREDLTLDAAGAARAAVRDLRAAESLRELLVEAEYRDPNGELQTVSSTVPLWPARLLAGIEPEQWLGSDREVKAKIAVVDAAGRAVAGAPVRVDVRRRVTYSHRKRLVGGFYAYDHVDEIGPVLATLCEGVTDARGLHLCQGAAPASGDLILVAATRDQEGDESLAHATVWVTGERAWFRVADSDRMDVLPEKSEWSPGETARLQVRMPFAEATALVTSEREGIIDARVVRLSGENPVIEVPVAAEYSPNVFVSVLAVRGRVAAAPPTAMIDLGKPAFKLGIAEIRVGWQPHTLVVEVEPEREVYEVRDTARVAVRVRTAAGAVPPAGAEIALAAVDEGLLELQPNESWNLLRRMMGRRGYDVQTSTAQMQVVGKRHFGLKARPHGGGGGRQTTRELFDTLLLWKGRIALDENGEATAEVPLNDSLTSFRIAAVATAGAGLFGNGAAAIRSTQDLMILSGLPALAREGDRFAAEFTLRNTTAAPVEARVAGSIEGVAAGFESRTLPLAPGESRVVGWEVEVPVGVESLRYTVEAEANGASDRLSVTQQVRPAVPVRIYQAALLRLDRPIEETVAAPAGALPGRGGVEVGFAPTIAAGLDGVRDWMARYPYTCLEQRVSRAVALRDASAWERIAGELPSYLDTDGLLKFFPRMASGSEVLTSYVLSIALAADLALPEDVRGKLVEGLSRFVGGQIARPSPIAAVDLSLRKLSAIAALARAGAATPAMLDSIAIEPNLWPTSALLDWWEILARLPADAPAAARRTEVEQIVRARLNLRGTTMGFSTEERDGLWWLMVCPDGNAARAVLLALEAGVWRDDLPRLLRGLMQRQRRGAWDCTVSNAWGVLATEKFVAAFEAEAPAGVSSVSLDGAAKTVAWAAPPEPAAVEFAWPPAPAALALEHRGAGAPWVTVQSRAALPLEAPLASGYRIEKTIAAVEGREPGRLSVGDVLRVRLEVEAQADMTWVVIDDPIPAGASHLGTGLGRDSQIATAGEREEDWNAPAFVERGFAGYRAYWAWLPKGRLVTEYTIRLNQAGTMHLPATRAEALYAPETFGELPNAAMVIQP
jgi:hypothetical protein